MMFQNVKYRLFRFFAVFLPSAVLRRVLLRLISCAVSSPINACADLPVIACVLTLLARSARQMNIISSVPAEAVLASKTQCLRAENRIKKEGGLIPLADHFRFQFSLVLVERVPRYHQDFYQVFVNVCPHKVPALFHDLFLLLNALLGG